MTRLPVDTDYLLDQLRAMLAIPSPTGYTDRIARHVAAELQKLGLEIELTRRGAIRAFRKGRSRRPARAIVTHLDTLGAQAICLMGGLSRPIRAWLNPWSLTRLAEPRSDAVQGAILLARRAGPYASQ